VAAFRSDRPRWRTRLKYRRLLLRR
jgi:hypothetical protein